MAKSSTDFQWPWQYDFPPFFTLQPNEETRRKQMDAWCQLVLSYFESKRQSSVDIPSLSSTYPDLFSNQKINRKANRQLIRAVFNELHNRGNLEWNDRSHQSGIISWRKANSWAADIERWVRATGRGGTVCTVYEIIDGDDTEGESFHGLDRAVVLEALAHLERNGKAEIMDGGDGVKFFI